MGRGSTFLGVWGLGFRVPHYKGILVFGDDVRVTSFS